ncbi:MAG: prepilin-type N-terminal cleavage/methylation domain-containing protein [Fibrobacter sp.]|jgi:prepilin-type N-terminal cleavage/methylation domain-containing protein|nr:prepilin-type N-terminal cleavage/methylation domain-containing protein [Fibrobacter sp.]MCR5377469.1 prepilin-type N-terminal cleavage/methylation domain-containing protein [Fibrobacter sp.]
MKECYGKSRGFTLPEVCVALAVFAFGALALGRGFDAVLRVRSVERSRAQSLIEAVAQMEALIENPPACTDSLASGGATPVRGVFRAITGQNGVQLQRLVKCR